MTEYTTLDYDNPITCEETGMIKYPTREMTEEERAQHDAILAEALVQKGQGVRAARDQALSNCDWTVGVDSPLSDEQKELWRTYRQQLRDLPNDPNFPNIEPDDFPVKPS